MNDIITFFLFGFATTAIITIPATLIANYFGVQGIYLDPNFHSFNTIASVAVGALAVYFSRKKTKEVKHAAIC